MGEPETDVMTREWVELMDARMVRAGFKIQELESRIKALEARLKL